MIKIRLNNFYVNKLMKVFVFIGCSPEYLEILMSLSTLFQTQQLNLNNIQFRNVTKLRLGYMYNRRFRMYTFSCLQN
jgi:hypothetical protein